MRFAVPDAITVVDDDNRVSPSAGGYRLRAAGNCARTVITWSTDNRVRRVHRRPTCYRFSTVGPPVRNVTRARAPRIAGRTDPPPPPQPAPWPV